jgi:hypothetical protein
MDVCDQLRSTLDRVYFLTNYGLSYKNVAFTILSLCFIIKY